MSAPDSAAESSVPHEFIDAEISVEGLRTPADENVLNSALSGLEGIQRLAVSHGTVSVEYEPVLITKAQLGERIERAGYHVTGVESGSASPMTDALHHDQA